MTKLDRLIAKLCPNGVEYKMLGEIGEFYGGLTGKSKEDFRDGNAKFITYMNVFSHLAVNINITDYVKVAPTERQHSVAVGDILFTGSSETREECGMSAVLTEDICEPLYLNSFCFGFRLFDAVLLPEFSKYLFRSDALRKQIIMTASGVTRFNVSKEKMKKVKIPLPPIPIQTEIYTILDNFTTFEAELETQIKAELDARKKQYTYYKDNILTFREKYVTINKTADSRRIVRWMTLGEVGELVRGNGLQKKDFVISGIGCIHYGQIYTYYGTFTNRTKSYVSPELAKTLRVVKKGDVILTNTSENVDDVCKAVAWLGDDDIVTGGHATIFKHGENPKYIAYYTQTSMFNKEKRKYASGTKVIDVSANNMAKIMIPIPPIEVQNRIVEILDKFEVIINDIISGLPAEIASRRKQYEYYRDKLLTFKEIV
jgi:type I restriction enzyme S subunit